MRDAVPPCKTTGRGGALEPPPTTGPADPTASGALPRAPEGDSKPHLNNLPPKRFPPGGSALGGYVRRQGLVRLPPGAGLSGEGLTARPSRPNDSPSGAQADGATDTTADDHPAVNAPPRTRPTATPSPGPALTSPARRAYCVISAIRFACGWRARGSPDRVESSRSLSGAIAPAAQDLTGVPSWPASRSRDVLES